MDKLYRNTKTGETKTLPEKVYQANRSRWQPVPEVTPEPKKRPITDPDEKVNLEILEKVTKEPLTKEIEDKTGEQSQETTDADKSKEELQAEYEALAGKKPDGRWSEKKLAEQIQELKETK
jgi:hypothetical protein